MFNISNIGKISRTYRHFNRYRQIITVLFKYGFDDIIKLLKIEKYIEIGFHIISKQPTANMGKLDRAVRVRMVFEELGPTFIKLGQILSTRPDIIPFDFVNELSKLQDEVPPCTENEIREILTKELGAPPEEFFEFFDKTPIASASIGQVHKGCFKSGEKIAVKIQRPNIKSIIEIDLEIMLYIATLMERHIKQMASYQPIFVVNEFAKALEKELDYTIEGINLLRFARFFEDDPTVYIPKVFQDKSTSCVLIMEYIKGVKISDAKKIDELRLDKKLITKRGANLILKQLFEHGIFHADPHPGNIFVMPKNIICLLDFGMIGTVDQKTKEYFVDLLASIVSRNSHKAVKALLKLSVSDQQPDIKCLEEDFSIFLELHLYKPLKQLEIAKLLRDLITIVYRHHIRILPNIFIMIKALSAVENIALKLDPDFDVIAHVQPFIEKIKLAKYNPIKITSDILKSFSESLNFMQQFPKDLLDITTLIKQKKITLKIEHNGLESIITTLDQISNKISLAIIIAALIIGSALIVFAKIPPFFSKISLIGIIGFLSAAVVGIWLLVAILKKRKF